MKLVENSPLDTTKMANLISDQEGLFLVWPKAKYPFDHAQWKGALDPEEGHISFFIYEGRELIGHVALLKSREPDTYKVGFLYLLSEFRSRGLGTEVVQQLENYAIGRLKTKKLHLVVRDYNPRALRCYIKSGFQEYAREGTLIKMRKVL